MIAGKRNWFTLVNFSNGKVEDDVIDESLGFVNCFLRLRDNKTILCGCSKEEFCFYDIESRKYIKTYKKGYHTDSVNDLVKRDDETFASCSRDKTIKIWKY